MFGYGKTTELKKRITTLERNVGAELAKAEIRELEIKSLRDEVSRLKAEALPREKRRENLSRKTGYTKVGAVESQDMYDMYQQGTGVAEIAEHLHRSQGCVSVHIRKHMEE